MPTFSKRSARAAAMPGRVMLDLSGPELSIEERELLLHPECCGVILFTRNYVDPEQITALCTTLHGLKSPPLLVAVDHEGGPVQRFRFGFTPLPPCAALGRLHDRDPVAALRMARLSGFVMAAELRAVGVDVSFAPVLDLDRGLSAVIGERAFHRDPETVALLASAYIEGMGEAGMAAIGKHFPGHGTVGADSHVALPIDDRPYVLIEREDLLPFARLARAGLLGIMPAHVVYPQVDGRPAGFSAVWLGQVLRTALGFEGAIVSDDLSMAGAAAAGPFPDRARAALEAGCDMLLVCNHPEAAAEILTSFPHPAQDRPGSRLAALYGHPAWQDGERPSSAYIKQVASAVAAFAAETRFQISRGPRVGIRT